MNEKIKQLARQSQMVFWPTDPEVVELSKDIDIEKFAKLLIRECADICEKDGRWWAEKGYLMEAGEAGSLATQIREHFGVNE